MPGKSYDNYIATNYQTQNYKNNKNKNNKKKIDNKKKKMDNQFVINSHRCGVTYIYNKIFTYQIVKKKTLNYAF